MLTRSPWLGVVTLLAVAVAVPSPLAAAPVAPVPACVRSTVLIEAGSAPAASTFLLASMSAPPRWNACQPPVFADYVAEFLDYWKGVFRRQNGVVMGVLAVGVVALFIITRSKWHK